MRTAAIALIVAAGSASAQPLEFVVGEYTLAGTLVRHIAGAGEDTNIANNGITLDNAGNVVVTRSTLSSPNPFKGAVATYTRTGSLLSSVELGTLNSATRMLRDAAVDSQGNIFVAARNGIGPIGIEETRGSIFRIDANTQAVTRLQPLAGAPDYDGIAVTPDDRLYVSAFKGGADQMLETNGAGATLNTFSPTGPGVFHRDIAYNTGGGLAVLVRDNGPTAGNGWKYFNDDGTLLFTVDLGDAADYNFVGLDFDNTGTLWTYNRATDAVERYNILGSLIESHPIALEGDFLRDFMYTPDGAALFAYRTQVPSPASALLLGLAGLTATRRRR